MQLNRFRLLFSIALVCAAAGLARADVKIKQRQSVGGQTLESTVYIKGKRERREQKLPGLNTTVATITQCDLKRTIQLSDQTRKYIITPFDDTGAPQPPAMSPRANSSGARKGGIVTYQMNVTDTGERRVMFGLTARHIKTTFISDATPDACNKEKQHIETDGWYVDLDYSFSCDSDKPFVPMMSQRQPGCRDEVRFKQTGSAAKLGYPLTLTTTIYDQNNQPTATFTQETVELSRSALDPALFDVPTDYAEAKSPQELYNFDGMNALSAMSRENQSAANENDASNALTSSSSNNANNQPSESSDNPLATAGTVGSVAGGKTGAVAGGIGAVSGIFGRKQPKTKKDANTVTNTNNSNANANSANASTTAASSSSSAVEPKKAGSIRVGVIAVGNPNGASFSADAARSRLISALNSAGLDAVPINAQSISKVFDEARDKQCDFVLYTDVANLKQPGKTAEEGGGLLGKSPLGRLGGKGSAVYDAAVQFRLLPVPESGDEAAPQLESNSNGKADSDINALGKAFDTEAKSVAASAKKRG
jgi:hypothetical protein